MLKGLGNTDREFTYEIFGLTIDNGQAVRDKLESSH